ncbi:putative tail protein [Thermus phage phiLo]|nr:putative tail protein [Thermus phage phiLo]
MLFNKVEWLTHRRINQGFFPGKVVDNEDPKKLGRVKIESYVWEGVPKDKLPWAVPLFHAYIDTNDDKGWFSVPEVGSEVLLFFPFEDIYFPAYMSRVMSDPHKVRSRIREKNYPKRYGWVDDDENWWIVDKKEDFIELRHTSGLIIHINKDGDIKILHPVGRKLYVDAKYLHVTGNIITDGYLVAKKFVASPLFSSVVTENPSGGSPGDAYNINSIVSKLNEFISKYDSHFHIGNLGAPTSPPNPIETPKPPDGVPSPDMAYKGGHGSEPEGES